MSIHPLHVHDVYISLWASISWNGLNALNASVPFKQTCCVPGNTVAANGFGNYFFYLRGGRLSGNNKSTSGLILATFFFCLAIIIVGPSYINPVGRRFLDDGCRSFPESEHRSDILSVRSVRTYRLSRDIHCRINYNYITLICNSHRHLTLKYLLL